MQVCSITERLHLSSQLRASLAGCSPDPVRLLAGSRFTQVLLNTDFVYRFSSTTYTLSLLKLSWCWLSYTTTTTTIRLRFRSHDDNRAVSIYWWRRWDAVEKLQKLQLPCNNKYLVHVGFLFTIVRSRWTLSIFTFLNALKSADIWKPTNVWLLQTSICWWRLFDAIERSRTALCWDSCVSSILDQFVVLRNWNKLWYKAFKILHVVCVVSYISFG